MWPAPCPAASRGGDAMTGSRASASERRTLTAASRAVVSGIDDDGGRQLVQVTGYADEVLDGIERFQPYGLSGVAPVGAEAVLLSLGGSRAHSIAVAVEDRRYRLRALAGGEVALYDDQGQTVHLTRDGIVVTSTRKVTVSAPEVGITASETVTINAPQVTISASEKVTLSAPVVQISATTKQGFT